MTIKAVTLDFGGTLAEGELDRNLFRERLFSYLHSLGFSGGEYKLTKALKGMLEKLTRIRKLNREIRIEEFYTSVLSRLGVHPEDHVLEYIHELYLESFQIEIIPEVEKILEYLRGKYRLAVISNASSEIPRYSIRKFGLERYFDAIVISKDIGIRKPDPEIFRFALQKLRLNSHEAIHVGDSIDSDVVGAKNAGMKAIWINKTFEESEIEADYTINSIREITSIL